MIGQATCIVMAEAHARVLRIAIGKLLSVVRASWSAVKGRGPWFTGIFVVGFGISHYSIPHVGVGFKGIFVAEVSEACCLGSAAAFDDYVDRDECQSRERDSRA